MPAETQTRLLRVLSDGEYYRVGGHEAHRADVRIIAATHQNLEDLVSQNRFREDLYHRLNVIRIHIPTLRERQEDIPLLAKYFLAKAAEELNEESKTLTRQAMNFISNLPWPGNVRQLENVIERALTLNQGRSQIEIGDLPQEIQAAPNSLENFQVTVPDEGLDFSLSIHDIERQIIRQALEKSGGNKRRAADLLKLKRTTLIEKMKRLYT